VIAPTKVHLNSCIVTKPDNGRNDVVGSETERTVKAFRVYRECAGAMGMRGKTARRHIPDTAPCTEPLEKTYGDLFPIC
jgi:hypothetical protein